MPPPRHSNIIDRLLDFLLNKEPRGRERILLEAAQPPFWMRFIFALIFAGLAGGVLIGVFAEYDWLTLPWEPSSWPSLFVFFLLILATRFLDAEIHRQYGKRALREDQAAQ